MDSTTEEYAKLILDAMVHYGLQATEADMPWVVECLNAYREALEAIRLQDG